MGGRRGARRLGRCADSAHAAFAQIPRDPPHAPPSDADAHKRTKDYLNIRFKTFQEVQDSHEFDELVAITSTRNDDLKIKVRP